MRKPIDRQDAFGHEVYDYHLGKTRYEIIERDDGYCDGSTNLRAYYFSQYAEWHEPLKHALRFAKGRALDVGCGPGRVALYLQSKGMDVLGIDISPLALKVAKLRGVKKTRLMSITQVSRKLGIFDTILMCGSNFGLFGSFERARWLLRRFRGMTSKDAKIIAETRDPYRIDEPAHLAYHAFNRRRGRMPGQVRIRVRYKAHISPWFDYLFVSKDEMRKILHGTGWRVAQFFDSGEPEYVAVMEKE